MPRRINAPSVYWPQKVLAVATVHAAMHNQVASDVGRKSDPGFSAAEGQGAHLLKFEVPTYYVSEELIAAAARTDLPTDIFLDALPFPFPALVFMFPKGTIRHAVQRRMSLPSRIASRKRTRQKPKLATGVHAIMCGTEPAWRSADFTRTPRVSLPYFFQRRSPSDDEAGLLWRNWLSSKSGSF
jgi:hypothetical protein